VATRYVVDAEGRIDQRGRHGRCFQLEESCHDQVASEMDGRHWTFGASLESLLVELATGRGHQRLLYSKFPFSCWNAPDYYFKFWIFIPGFGIAFQQLGIWLGFSLGFSYHLLFLHLPLSFPLRYCLLGA
jgi:hypothetical protein